MFKKLIGQILMSLLPILFLLLVVWLVNVVKTNNLQKNTKPEQPITTITPTETRPPSRWATDSGVLEVEENLKTISNELKAVDLKESGLLPPLLDMKIKF